MRLYFWHRNKKISLYRGPREPEVLHSRVAGAEINAHQLVTVQIDESDSIVPKNRSVAALREHELRISLMPWSLSYDHLFGSHPAKALRSGRNEDWMGIDGVAGDVIDQVGLQSANSKILKS
jgi:hypothetical protein